MRGVSAAQHVHAMKGFLWGAPAIATFGIQQYRAHLLVQALRHTRAPLLLLPSRHQAGHHHLQNLTHQTPLTVIKQLAITLEGWSNGKLLKHIRTGLCGDRAVFSAFAALQLVA